jgi:hypothetical protein
MLLYFAPVSAIAKFKLECKLISANVAILELVLAGTTWVNERELTASRTSITE